MNELQHNLEIYFVREMLESEQKFIEADKKLKHELESM